jgi:hypothetical protein
MICAAERMPPSSDHLLFDAHPPVIRPMVTSEVTAITNRMPMSRSAAMSFCPNGITTNVADTPTNTR